MYNYLFSLFCRYSIVLSGFIVFIFTSYQFGPEGRGIIAIGGSIISIIGIIFSFNLGRSFISLAKQNKILKENLIKSYIKLHLVLIFLAIFVAFIYMFFSNHLYELSLQNIIFLFLIGIPFYLWGVNNNDIYASFDMTFKQEVIILSTRIVLIIVLALLWLLNANQIFIFLLLYYFTLSVGSLVEMIYIYRQGKLKDFSILKKYLPLIPKLIKYAHSDYLAFHLYPFFLILLSTFFLDLKELGKLNFAIQITSFIFLLSIVASIRMKSYVSMKGTKNYSKNIIILFFITSILSFFAFVLCIFLVQDFVNYFFSSFGDIRKYLLILLFSIPGHLLYQFNLPVMLEKNQLKKSAVINGMNFIFCLFIAFFAIKYYGIYGFCVSFSLFYMLQIPFNFLFLRDNYKHEIFR
tara:strand:+ start:7267 stop:8487 length:1221 start_codon:yes stop_codon:yes gene_type:complete